MTQPNDVTLPPSPLDEVIAAYLLALESGEKPDREIWVRSHPEVADGLRAYFADQDGIDRAVAPLRDAMETLASSEARADVPGAIPYFGDYQLLEEIDRGGMGVVFKARQVSLGRPVALKMILSGQFAGPDDVRRFRDEASAAAGLDHPNIVPIYEVGEHDGRQYFSMKLIEGSSLRREMASFRERPADAARLIVAVARAVHYAHQHGIIHRDLKPANILLDRKGQPHVTDFGLAKRFGDSAGPAHAQHQFTLTGAVLGTPAYMSPEQAAGRHKDVSTSTDIYSLGAILYEMLTGRPPFGGETALDVLTQVKQAEPTQPRRLTPGLNHDLEIICLKCLRKEPNLRYGTAEALADDLDRWLRGEPIVARPVGAAERAWRWCRRNPLVAGLVAAVALALVLGIAVSSYFAIQANDKATLAQANEARALKNQQQADTKAAEAQANATEAQAQAVQARKQKDRADANAMRFGRDLYVADLRMAQQAWDQGRISRLLELLNGQRPEKTIGIDLRGFEWHYWNRLCHTDLLTLQSGGANSVAYSPDGKRLAFGGTNYNLKIVNAATGALILDLKDRHKSNVIWCLAFSPDGQRLASGTGEFGSPRAGDIQICDATTGKELTRFPELPVSITSLAFSPDGKWLASSAGDKTVRIRDTTTAEETFNLTANATIWGVAFSPDGKRIATASDNFPMLGKPGELKAWNVADRTEALDFKGHTGRIFSVAFSPDGKRLASSGSDGVKVWDAATAKEIRSLPGEARSVTFSHDGKRIAAGDNAVHVWNASTGSELATFKGHTSLRILGLAFSPDGSRIASTDGWEVKVWDATANQEPLSPKTDPNSWYTSTAFTPDGNRLVAAGFGPLRAWDVATGAETLKVTTGDKGMLCLAISPDGTRIAVGGEDKTIKLLDAMTGEQTRALAGHTTRVNGVAFSPDGNRIASVSGDQNAAGQPPPEIKVWDANTGKELLGFTGNSREIECIAFSPDGKRIAGGITQYSRPRDGNPNGEFVSGEVQLWDASTGQELFRLKHDHHVFSVVFSADGTRIAGGSLSSTTKVWDAATGREICTLKGHTGDVHGVQFSPDGKRVASVSDDGTLKVWDSTTGQETLTMKTAERLLGVAFSPEGKRLAAVGGRTVRIWSASSPGSIVLGSDGKLLPLAE